MTEESAEMLFGSENPLGKVILINGNNNYTITGIIQNPPLNSTIDFEMLVPSLGFFLSLEACFACDPRGALF